MEIIEPMLDKKATYTGTQIAYAVLCETKLWYFSHFIRMEQGSDLVAQGRLLNETAFQREKKDQIIDERISLDIVRRGERVLLREIKKSKKLEKAHVFQLLYYLHYLREKGVQASGEITYPLSREVRNVELGEEEEQGLVEVMERATTVVQLPAPPQPVKKPYCRKCSYFNLCWVK